MSYPAFNPSSRAYDPGDWANKRFNSISGAEVRIRYGDKRYNAKLSLTYTNITDTQASDFLAHYNEQYGTHKAFVLPTAVLAGWGASSYIPNESVMRFRYAQAPRIDAVRPGISTVSVNLTGVV
jgi:hypothetical protein